VDRIVTGDDAMAGARAIRRYDDEGKTAAIILGSATPFPRHSDATADRAGFGSAGERGTTLSNRRFSVC